MMIKRSIVAALLLAHAAGPAAAQDAGAGRDAVKAANPAPAPRPLQELTCWQNGVAVVQIKDIISTDPPYFGNVTLRLTDGSKVQLGGTDEVPALCLLRPSPGPE